MSLQSRAEARLARLIIKTFSVTEYFFLLFFSRSEEFVQFVVNQISLQKSFFAAQSLMIRNGQIFVTSFPLGMLLMPEFTNSHNFLEGFW